VKSVGALYLELIRWNRPAGWLLLLWPTLSALWIASHGFPGWHLVIVFTLGTFLMRSAGCCINDVADRDFDRHVKRTAQRPVTSGKLKSREALAAGAVLAQQEDVLNTIQVLRGRAQAAGTLRSGEQITVTVQPAEAVTPSSTVVVRPPPQVIVIAPSRPERGYALCA